MYYIYDETPNVGFVSLENGIGTYVKPGYSVGKASKKQHFTAAYSNPKFQKINNEHVVDSHFKVRKTSSRYTIPVLPEPGRLPPYDKNEGKNKAQRIVDEYRNTEAPQQPQQNMQHQLVNSGQQDNQNNQGDYGTKPNEEPIHTQSSNNQQVQPIRSKPVNAAYSSSMRQRNQDTGSNQRNQGAERSQRNQDLGRSQMNQDVGRNQMNSDLGRGQRNQDFGRNQRHKEAGRSQINQEGVHDSKTTYMNVRKAPISAETLLLNNNHQLTSLSIISQDKRQKTSMMMDKTLHKASGIANDRNKQVMSRVLDDMTNKIADRRHRKGEYVNRDIEEHLDTIYEKSKRSVIAENLRKYIGKDKVAKDKHRQMTPLARIGSHEESLDDDTPYAVFYRMNPESLDRQDGFMLTRAIDDNGSSDFSSKEKRLHTGFQDDTESMTGIINSKTNSGAMSHRKKLMNFSSYMSY